MQRMPSSIENDLAVTISSGSAVRPCASMAAMNPRYRARPVETSCGPAMWAMRVCPSPARWATAIRMPRSLSTETDGRL